MLLCGDTPLTCGCGRVFEATSSTVGPETATNPFLRCVQPAAIESGNHYLGARASGPVQVFAALRQWKNQY